MVSDVWLLDLRYGNDECAKALSGVENYMKCAKDGLEFIIDRSSRLILRILVLPGHVDCCHKPALELLSQYKDIIFVSILDQYIPEHEAHLNQNLKRRPSKKELFSVDAIAKKNDLRYASIECDDFWKN
jgi:putative pyruvate formate lyase activating enzyme